MTSAQMTTPTASDDLGQMLSCQGRSYCTYIFAVTDRMPAHLPAALRAYLARVTGGRSEVFYTADDRAAFAVRIDHALVDAQRGLAMALAGMDAARADNTRYQDIPVRAGILERHSVATVPSHQLTAEAKASGQTATQKALQRIWPALMAHGVDTVRLIVSKANTVSPDDDQQFGNHFVPVDVTAPAMALMINKPAGMWRKLLARLTKTAERVLGEAADGGDEVIRDTLTVTSVGSLEAITDHLTAHGLAGMIMYPEQVSWCSTVITVYSLFGQTYFIFSGRGALGPLLRSQFHGV